MTEQRAYDWDSEIQDDGDQQGEFFVFDPESIVDFKVKAMTRTTSHGLNCPMAKLDLELSDGEHKARCLDNLILHSKAEWKLCQFFSAIGQRRHGEKIKPRWNEVEGASGRCKVGVRTYEKNGEEREINEVLRYLEPEDGATEQAAAAGDFDNVSFD